MAMKTASDCIKQAREEAGVFSTSLTPNWVVIEAIRAYGEQVRKQAAGVARQYAADIDEADSHHDYGKGQESAAEEIERRIHALELP